MNDETPFQEHNRNKYSGLYRPPLYIFLLKMVKNRVFWLCMSLGFIIILFFSINKDKIVNIFKGEAKQAIVVDDEEETSETIVVIEQPSKAVPTVNLKEIRSIIKEELKIVLKDKKPSPPPRDHSHDKIIELIKKQQQAIRDIKKNSAQYTDRTIALKEERKRLIRDTNKKAIKYYKVHGGKYKYLIDKYFENPVGRLCVQFGSQKDTIKCWVNGALVQSP